MSTAYDASPECRVRKCYIKVWHEIMRPVVVYQHGRNPEAVLIIDRFTLRHDPAAHVRQEFRAFAESCHRYEDGEAD